MDTKIVSFPGEHITDWGTFHTVCQEVFGFPDFYGRNMNAWIDCMTDLDAPENGMTKINVAKGGLVVIRLDNADDFKKRCPEQYDALIESAAFVNYRRVELGEAPVLALLMLGFY